jgi:hypothetical protein
MTRYFIACHNLNTALLFKDHQKKLFFTLLLSTSFLFSCDDNNTPETPVEKTAIDFLTSKPWRTSKVTLDGEDITELILEDRCDSLVRYTYRRDLKDILVTRALLHYKFLRYDSITVEEKGKKVRQALTVNDTTYCWKGDKADKYSNNPLYVVDKWELSSDQKSIAVSKVFAKTKEDEVPSIKTIKELTENKMVLVSKEKNKIDKKEYLLEINYENK